VSSNAPWKTVETIYGTEVWTVFNLDTERHFFERTTTPHGIWVNLMEFNSTPDFPVLVPNPGNNHLSRGVNQQFETAAKRPF
jgi:penicillin V acylase-like amidase (Ntn superfamily)